MKQPTWIVIVSVPDELTRIHSNPKSFRIKYWLLVVISTINLLKPTGYVMHQQFNIQQLYALPTLYLYVLYLYENKQRLVPLTA